MNQQENTNAVVFNTPQEMTQNPRPLASLFQFLPATVADFVVFFDAVFLNVSGRIKVGNAAIQYFGKFVEVFVIVFVSMGLGFFFTEKICYKSNFQG